MPRALLLFLKFPTPGRVKTRLAAGIGPEAAADVYRLLVARVLANLAGVEADVRVLFDPPDTREATLNWIRPQLPLADFPAVEFLAQAEGDLGHRLARGFSDAFKAGYTQVAAIGSDCITLTAEILGKAWVSLESTDTVFGPTQDGGYYLVGTRSFQPALFRGIPWSSETTLSATLTAATDAGLTATMLTRLSDIDTFDDWQTARKTLKNTSD